MFLKLLMMIYFIFCMQLDLFCDQSIYSIHIIPETIQQNEGDEQFVANTSISTPGDYTKKLNSSVSNDIQSTKIKHFSIDKNKDKAQQYLLEAEQLQDKIDKNNLTKQLYTYLKLALEKKHIKVLNESAEVILYFMIDEISHSELSGKPYIFLVHYRMIYNQGLVYVNKYQTRWRKSFFSGKHLEILNTKQIAEVMVNDLLNKIHKQDP